jgi:hypothetical protein
MGRTLQRIKLIRYAKLLIFMTFHFALLLTLHLHFQSGVYEIIITIARKGGLDGRICKEWSIVPCPAQLPSRVYRTLDLLWGPTSDGNLEYFSATWSGLLLPSFTENYSLIISTVTHTSLFAAV